jgi:polyisoprenoid-binding protein YceI
MRTRFTVRALLGSAIAFTIYVALGPIAKAQAPLAMGSARITISGTSNIHTYTASTATATITRAQFAGAAVGSDFWTNVLRPGAVEAFEVAIPAATLTSPREGLDKNMHKALDVKNHPTITFRLLRLEATSASAATLRAVGVLQIAGAEREIAIDIATEQKGSGVVVTGQLPLLMTDFGIKPPVAMLGMLKTDPKVTVAFEVMLDAAPVRTTSTIH